MIIERIYAKLYQSVLSEAIHPSHGYRAVLIMGINDFLK